MTRCDIAKTFRRALVLLGGSALCVLILICAFTDAGAHTLFRLGVRLTSETVDISDTAYLEYYDVKQQLPGKSSVRFWLGEATSSGYDAALDFLKFVKQNIELSTVRMDIPDVESASQYLTTGDSSLLSATGCGSHEQQLLVELYLYNSKLPPQKRVTVATSDDSCGKSEFVIEYSTYDPSCAEADVLDVSVVYPDTEGCDPLFDVSVEGVRFGTLTRLSSCTSLLEAVSGNFGRAPFTGLAQPEFYFLVGGSASVGE